MEWTGLSSFSGVSNSTSVEFEVSLISGEITGIALERSSGVQAFDLAVLETLLQASPFEVAHEFAAHATRLGLRWEFSADSRLACTTFNLRFLDISE